MLFCFCSVFWLTKMNLGVKGMLCIFSAFLRERVGNYVKNLIFLVRQKKKCLIKIFIIKLFIKSNEEIL